MMADIAALGRHAGAAMMLLAAHPCRAAPVTIELDPSVARIGLTVFAIGLWPIPGHFARFSGRLTVDPVMPRICRISVDVSAASLTMAGEARTRLALGPALLDVTRYPRLAYSGACGADAAPGRLTLHGVTQPLVLIPKRAGDDVQATGSLRRQDYGVAGLPGLIGRRVDVMLSITLPPGLAARLAPE